MAITFEPLDITAKDQTITIGGSTATGPFPNYSIGTEVNKTDVGDIIGLTYNISVTGRILSSGDVTTEGKRQGEMHKQMQVWHRKVLTNNLYNMGRLEIAPYGGMADIIQFDDAILENIEFSEQDDASSGVQYVEYSLSFVAHENSKWETETNHLLASADESWEITEGEAVTFRNDPDIDDDVDAGGFELSPWKTFNITHTISATGYKSGSSNIYQKMAYENAKKWVESRMQSTLKTAGDVTAQMTNFRGDDNPANPDTDGDYGASPGPATYTDGKKRLYPLRDLQFGLDTDGSSTEYTNPAWTGYNRNVTASSNLAAGDYSVTQTWVFAPESATYSLELSMEESTDGETSITVSGTVTGFNKEDANSKRKDGLIQAEAALDNVLGNTYRLANNFYNESGPGQYNPSVDPDVTDALKCTLCVLSSVERTKSIGKNPVDGSITFSVSYNDGVINVTNAVSETLGITDSNYYTKSLGQGKAPDGIYGSDMVAAVLQIIGKADGPIIQTMGTTPERKRSISLEVVMPKRRRLTSEELDGGPEIANGVKKPMFPPRLACKAVVDGYKPAANAVQQGKSEQWDVAKGSYSISMEWLY